MLVLAITNTQLKEPRFSELVYTYIFCRLPKFLVPSGLYPVSAKKLAAVAVNVGLSLIPGIHVVGAKDILDFTELKFKL